MSENKLYYQRGRVNNLKNIDVEIPRDKLVVITGLSGSGNPPLLSIRYMPKDSAAMWRVFLLMPASSWGV